MGVLFWCSFCCEHDRITNFLPSGLSCLLLWIFFWFDESWANIWFWMALRKQDTNEKGHSSNFQVHNGILFISHSSQLVNLVDEKWIVVARPFSDPSFLAIVLSIISSTNIVGVCGLSYFYVISWCLVVFHIV